MSSSSYSLQLKEKEELSIEEFSPYFSGTLKVYPSPPEHYRMRAEFRVWHDQDDLYHIMFNKETKEKYRVDSFPAASKLINRAMEVLIPHIKSSTLLRKKLFQIDYLSSLSNELVISLLYHKPLTNDWEEALNNLQKALKKEGIDAHFIGRARKEKRIIGDDYVIEKLSVHNKEYYLKQVENSFTQPNAIVAQKMLEWVVKRTKDSTHDLLELYCGNGNFSIALSPNFKSVLATEVAKVSVNAAQWNIVKNNISNLKIVRLSAEEFTEALEGRREFKRLQQAEVTLTDYDFQTVLVDPPRAGIDEDALRSLQRYPKIVYISCNPKTLLENLKILTQTHTVTDMALFDQFPYTQHRELGIILER